MKVDPKKKMVAITLDDGPHKTLTERAMNAFENIMEEEHSLN